MRPLAPISRNQETRDFRALGGLPDNAALGEFSERFVNDDLDPAILDTIERPIANSAELHRRRVSDGASMRSGSVSTAAQFGDGAQHSVTCALVQNLVRTEDNRNFCCVAVLFD